MSSIKSLYRRVQRLEREIFTDRAIEQAFKENAEELVEENKRQLFTGYDRKGKRLKKYRNPMYGLFKHSINPLPGLGNPDFFVSGRFYSTWKLKVSMPNLIHTFGVPYADKLLKRDPNIVGLGGKFKSDFVKFRLNPSFRRIVRKRLKM